MEHSIFESQKAILCKITFHEKCILFHNNRVTSTSQNKPSNATEDIDEDMFAEGEDDDNNAGGSSSNSKPAVQSMQQDNIPSHSLSTDGGTLIFSVLYAKD